MWPFRRKPAPKASAENPSYAEALERLRNAGEWVVWPGGIDRDSAAAWPVVWRAVSLISSSMACVIRDGLVVVDRDRRQVKTGRAAKIIDLLTETPDAGTTTGLSFVEDAVSDLLLAGNAVIRIRRSPLGEPLLTLCNPIAVTVDESNRRGGYEFRVSPDDLEGGAEIGVGIDDLAIARWNRATGRRLGATHRSRFLSQPVITTLATTLMLGIDAERFVGRFFRRGAEGGSLASDIAILFEDVLPSEAQERLAEMLKSWSDSNGRAPLVLGNGAKIHDLKPTPQDSDALGLRKFSVEDGARIFGVPAMLLGAEGGGNTYGSSISRLMRAYVEWCLKSHTARLLEPLSLRLLDPGHRLAVDWSRASVGDFEILKDLITACRPMPGSGDAVMTREELRSLIGVEADYQSDWEPVEGEGAGRDERPMTPWRRAS